MKTEHITNLYFSILESNSGTTEFNSRINEIEKELNEALKLITDETLRERLDSLTGSLAINSEFKGFALGLAAKEDK